MCRWFPRGFILRRANEDRVKWAQRWVGLSLAQGNVHNWQGILLLFLAISLLNRGLLLRRSRHRRLFAVFSRHPSLSVKSPRKEHFSTRTPRGVAVRSLHRTFDFLRKKFISGRNRKSTARESWFFLKVSPGNTRLTLTDNSAGLLLLSPLSSKLYSTRQTGEEDQTFVFVSSLRTTLASSG